MADTAATVDKGPTGPGAAAAGPVVGVAAVTGSAGEPAAASATTSRRIATTVRIEGACAGARVVAMAAPE